METVSARPAHRPPSTWAVRTAHVVALLPLPSSLWRLTLVFGMTSGYTDAGHAALGLDTVGIAWVIFVCLATEGAALLSLGLVREWGTRPPRWVPVVGGQVLPARFVVACAGAGAAVCMLLWTPFLFWWSMPHSDLTGTGTTVIGLLYLPMVAWGPLLAVLTVDYRRRRRRGDTDEPTPVPTRPGMGSQT